MSLIISVSFICLLNGTVTKQRADLRAHAKIIPLPQNQRAEASNSLSPKSAKIFLDLHPLHTLTTMGGSNSYRFPKLKGSENYESWSVDATSDLKAKGLWWVTSGKLKKPKSRNNSRFRKRSNKTCAHCERETPEAIQKTSLAP
jgi:hypothetical protein